MKSQRMKRVALAAVVAAGIAPVVTASPAFAGPVACLTYLDSKGCIVGPKLHTACGYSPLGGAGIKHPHPYCYAGLVKAGVRTGDASTACQRA